MTLQAGIENVLAKRHTIAIDGQEIELSVPTAEQATAFMRRMGAVADAAQKGDTAAGAEENLSMISEGVQLILPELSQRADGAEIAHKLLVASGGVGGPLTGKVLELLGVTKRGEDEADAEAAGPLATS